MIDDRSLTLLVRNNNMSNSHPRFLAHSQDIIELSAFGFWIANTLEAAIAINHAVRLRQQELTESC